MLHEFKQLRQEPGNCRRRWFESDGFDLILWLDEAETVTGFQICYDFGQGEHALTWRSRQGCSHDRVDAGDATPWTNETPILLPDGAVPWRRLGDLFEERSGTLEPSVRNLVRAALASGLNQ